MALQDFTIDTTDAGLDPKTIERKRLLAEALSKRGSDYSPVQSPWQGLARVGDALMGGLESRKLDQKENANKQAEAALLSAYPGASPVQAAAPMGAAPAMAASSAAPDTAGKIYNNDEPSPLDAPSGEDRRKMMATILGEAANEPQLGKNAVASVIRTRAVDGGYGGDTPSGVVTAKNQFEPWNTEEGRARMARALADPKQAAAADQAIASAYGEGGRAPADPTDGMTHFFSPGTQAALGRKPPGWAGGESVTIGGHVFNSPDDAPGKPVQVASASAFAPQDAVAAVNGAAAGPQAAPPQQVAQAPQQAELMNWAKRAALSSNPSIRDMGIKTLEGLNKPGGGLINAGSGKIYDPATKTWLTAPGSEEEKIASGYQKKKDGSGWEPIAGGPADPDAAAKLANARRGSSTPNSGDLIDSLADRLEAGDTTWKTGLARQPGLIKDVEEAVAKRAKTLKENGESEASKILQNRANQAGRVKEQATLGTAAASNTLYGNAAASTMNTAIEKSAAVPRGKFVPLNQLLQAGEKNISDPALAELRTATNTLVNDYAKAITPVGVPTEGAREHARELLQMAFSHEAYVAVVKTMHREIENTHQAIEFTKKQLQSGKGGGIPALATPSSKEPATPTAHPDETIATNPTTGERLIKRNGKWVPFT